MEASASAQGAKPIDLAACQIQVDGPLTSSDSSYKEVVAVQAEVVELAFPVAAWASDVKKRDIETEFLTLEEVSFTKEHKKRINVDPEVQGLNRYSDILPYEDTRVKLPQRPNHNKQDSYINANFIHGPLGHDLKIIAAQGPKPNTIEHFWRMVLQEQATTIICVCKLSEGGRPKCHKYWPDQDNAAEINSILGGEGGVKVKVVKTEGLSENLTLREIVVEGQNGEVLKTRQLHYTGWPDHGIPSGKSMQDFGLVLNQFIEKMTQQSNEKIIVHCSAGIGRTGTIISLMHLIINVQVQLAKKEQPRVSVFSTVRRLREQRMGMVQTVEQYQFIYLFMQNWLKQNQLI